MKFIGNWKAWESKDGSVKRIYVAEGKYLEEGELGYPSQIGLNFDEIGFCFKLIQGKTFLELFEMVKKSNSFKKTNKKVEAFDQLSTFIFLSFIVALIPSKDCLSKLIDFPHSGQNSV